MHAGKNGHNNIGKVEKFLTIWSIDRYKHISR